MSCYKNTYLKSGQSRGKVGANSYFGLKGYKMNVENIKIPLIRLADAAKMSGLEVDELLHHAAAGDLELLVYPPTGIMGQPVEPYFVDDEVGLVRLEYRAIAGFLSGCFVFKLNGSCCIDLFFNRRCMGRDFSGAYLYDFERGTLVDYRDKSLFGGRNPFEGSRSIRIDWSNYGAALEAYLGGAGYKNAPLACEVLAENTFLIASDIDELKNGRKPAKRSNKTVWQQLGAARAEAAFRGGATSNKEVAVIVGEYLFMEGYRDRGGAQLTDAHVQRECVNGVKKRMGEK